MIAPALQPTASRNSPFGHTAQPLTISLRLTKHMPATIELTALQRGCKRHRSSNPSQVEATTIAHSGNALQKLSDQLPRQRLVIDQRHVLRYLVDPPSSQLFEDAVAIGERDPAVLAVIAAADREAASRWAPSADRSAAMPSTAVLGPRNIDIRHFRDSYR